MAQDPTALALCSIYVVSLRDLCVDCHTANSSSVSHFDQALFFSPSADHCSVTKSNAFYVKRQRSLAHQFLKSVQHNPHPHFLYQDERLTTSHKPHTLPHIFHSSHLPYHSCSHPHTTTPPSQYTRNTTINQEKTTTPSRTYDIVWTAYAAGNATATALQECIAGLRFSGRAVES